MHSFLLLPHLLPSQNLLCPFSSLLQAGVVTGDAAWGLLQHAKAHGLRPRDPETTKEERWTGSESSTGFQHEKTVHPEEWDGGNSSNAPHPLPPGFKTPSRKEECDSLGHSL